jgi:aspartyl-tRNA(Asn)/glutamyl-tRNA(Gln) amidotransferase subunit A
MNLNRSLLDLVRGLRAGELRAVDFLREAAENLEATETRLGAYKTRTAALGESAANIADQAFRAGKDLGVLCGIPVAVKDIYGVPGIPIFAGSSRELPERFQKPGPIVQCLLDESAVIMGKTHTVEFAFGALGLNNQWPTPRNPWDAKAHRAPGGSSSGAGVALCQRSAVISLGTDTSGSVRIPAALTGNVGYKSTIGRWSTEGIVPLSPYLDTAGILARTVEDAMVAAGEIDRAHGKLDPGPSSAGADARDDTGAHADARDDMGRLRIGIPDELFWDDCDPGIAEGVREALAALERSGHRLVRISFPEAAQAFEIFRAGGTAGAELLAFLTRELPDWIGQLDPNVGTRMTAAAEISAAEWLGRKLALDALAGQARRIFEDVDVIATPTTAQTPPVLASIKSWDDYRPLNLKMARNTSIGNLLQLCALTMPVALDAAGMPVGLQVMAGNGRDRFLFAAGLAFEKVLGTGRERIGLPPAVSA